MMATSSSNARASTSSRLSLEQWDSFCPLSKKEHGSISNLQLLQNTNLSRPGFKSIPFRLLQGAGGGSSLHQSGNRNNRSNSTSRPTTPTPLANLRRSTSVQLDSGRTTPRNKFNHNTSSSSSSISTERTHPIETIQHFHDYFLQVERSLEFEQELIYHQHLSLLSNHLKECRNVLNELDDCRALLSEIEANYRFVQDNSSALQGACETMLDEQKHLIEVTEAINARLQYFRQLDQATKMLNSPGQDLVLQVDFLNVLDKLDASLDYLKANRDFKDSEIYLIRFQQCLTRSMTLIKMFFVSTIRKLTSQVNDKMLGKDLSETALQALLYSKFSTVSESLKILIYELEKRSQFDPNEYAALLQECYTVWFASRTQLLSTSLQEEVRRMDPNGSDLIKLAKAGCNHLRSICVAEFALYKQLFSSGEKELYHYLENLCDYLYDSLRPRILHEPKLETLCELCTVLSAMMGLDTETNVDDDDDDDADDDEDSDQGQDPNESQDVLTDLDQSIILHRRSTNNNNNSILTTNKQSNLGRMKFSRLLKTIQQDTQTRLVFRAQAVIQSEVLSYVPTAADLDYPTKLIESGQNDLALWTEDERLSDQSEMGGFRVPREEVQKDWYPTLKRTVWVLSKLNTYVNNAIFEDFAGEAVTLCRQSLSNAAIQIRSKPIGTDGQSKQIDGQLFLIRHLILLKEMIRSVDMVQIERAADFSSVTDALVNLLRNTSVIFNPNALFELASRGIPSFTETMRDAKTDLDSALKKACEELIFDASSTITNELKSFLDQCGTYLSSSKNNHEAVKDLPAQKWASAEIVTKLHDEFVATVEVKVGDVAKKLRVYLNDRKTRAVLLPPLLDEIVEVYTTFFNLTRSEYGFVTTSTLTQPSAITERLESAVAEI